ncbi:hypothetical protein ACLB2K_063617 [Fragaria x ananassa]
MKAALKFIILNVWDGRNSSSKARSSGLAAGIAVMCAETTDQPPRWQLVSHALCDPCYTASTSTGAAEFSLLRGKDKSGLCNDCLEVVRLAEENSEDGADGEWKSVEKCQEA